MGVKQLEKDTKCYRINDKWVDVRKGGKLFARMTPDKKKLRIIAQHKYIDVVVNKDGQLETLP